MSVEDKIISKWDTLLDLLEKEVLDNLNKPKNERKSISEITRNFAIKYDTTPSATQFYYYKHLKPKMDGMILSNEEETKEEELQYCEGQVVKVKVRRITTYGVFVETENNMLGLIHISQTATDFVESLHNFFYVGEELEAKILKIDEDGKLELSTKALGGKKRIQENFLDKDRFVNDSLSEKLKGIVPKVSEELGMNIGIQEAAATSVSNMEPEKETMPISNIATKDHTYFEKEKEQIVSFIKKYADNYISNKAMSDIEDMFEQFGVFKTTLALVETLRDIDVSLYITTETKKNLARGCLRP